MTPYEYQLMRLECVKVASQYYRVECNEMFEGADRILQYVMYGIDNRKPHKESTANDQTMSSDYR